MPGNYRFTVKRILTNGAYGISSISPTGIDIIKAGVFITSVTPNTGSPYGGTVLTITG